MRECSEYWGAPAISCPHPTPRTTGHTLEFEILDTLPLRYIILVWSTGTLLKNTCLLPKMQIRYPCLPFQHFSTQALQTPLSTVLGLRHRQEQTHSSTSPPQQHLPDHSSQTSFQLPVLCVFANIHNVKCTIVMVLRHTVSAIKYIPCAAQSSPPFTSRA